MDKETYMLQEVGKLITETEDQYEAAIKTYKRLRREMNEKVQFANEGNEAIKKEMAQAIQSLTDQIGKWNVVAQKRARDVAELRTTKMRIEMVCTFLHVCNFCMFVIYVMFQ